MTLRVYQYFSDSSEAWLGEEGYWREEEEDSGEFPEYIAFLILDGIHDHDGISTSYVVTEDGDQYKSRESFLEDKYGTSTP